MKSGRKSQSGVAVLAIILVLITLLIIAVIITVLLLNPNFFLKTNKISIETTTDKSDKTYELTCDTPYLKIGNSCCLDSNYNRICDSDEAILLKDKKETCSSPQVMVKGACCFDENSNGICDEKDYLLNRYYSDNSVDITGSIDSPFRLRELDADREEVSFRLENKDDKDYVIKNIDVDECDSEDFDKTIEAGEKARFSLDCDFGSGREKLDVEVTYTEQNSTQELTADGEIEIDFRDSGYYNNYYLN